VRYNLPQVGAHWDKDPFHNFWRVSDSDSSSEW
jgi:hypothetical protein